MDERRSMSNATGDKTIGAFEARRKFGNILHEVEVKGESFVVKKHGEAVAAVVPFQLYKQWKRSREAFFEKMRLVSERANVPEAEAEKIVREAIAAVRTQK